MSTANSSWIARRRVHSAHSRHIHFDSAHAEAVANGMTIASIPELLALPLAEGFYLSRTGVCFRYDSGWNVAVTHSAGQDNFIFSLCEQLSARARQELASVFSPDVLTQNLRAIPLNRADELVATVLGEDHAMRGAARVYFPTEERLDYSVGRKNAMIRYASVSISPTERCVWLVNYRPLPTGSVVFRSKVELMSVEK